MGQADHRKMSAVRCAIFVGEDDEEGNDAALCTSTRQRDLNRGKVCFLGVGCGFPANPFCGAVVPGTFVTTPTTTGLVNALCAVPFLLVLVLLLVFGRDRSRRAGSIADDAPRPDHRAGLSAWRRRLPWAVFTIAC